MNFLSLTKPRYTTERESNKRNPARPRVDYAIPYVICDRCGSWSSSERVRVPIPPELAPEFRLGKVNRGMPLQAWLHARDRWAVILGVSIERLTPGAEIGPPRGELLSNQVEDFVHPSYPGKIWVARSVVEAFRTRRVSGADFVEVETAWSRKVKDAPAHRVQLWELVVSGHAWRIGSDLERIILCDLCGRTGFAEISMEMTVD